MHSEIRRPRRLLGYCVSTDRVRVWISTLHLGIPDRGIAYSVEALHNERANQRTTHKPLRNTLLWLIFRILSGNPKKELLRGLWVLM